MKADRRTLLKGALLAPVAAALPAALLGSLAQSSGVTDIDYEPLVAGGDPISPNVRVEFFDGASWRDTDREDLMIVELDPATGEGVRYLSLEEFKETKDGAWGKPDDLHRCRIRGRFRVSLNLPARAGEEYNTFMRAEFTFWGRRQQSRGALFDPDNFTVTTPS